MAAARKITSGYRLSLVLGAVSCLVALLINLGATIYAATKPDLDKDGRGRRVLYTGSCDTSKNLNTGLHILINTMSSILLGASNYGIQCLSAPTREQVDKAHAEGSSLDVGIVSVRNLRHHTHLTRFLWFSLVLSSIPLHLLYNSVVFSSLTVLPKYPVVLIDERGEHAPDRLLTLLLDDDRPIDATPISYSTRDQPVKDLLTDYRNGGKFDKLEVPHCIDQYAVSFLTSRGGVFLVHEVREDLDIMEGQDFLLDWDSAKFDSLDSTGLGETFEWICRDLGREERCRPLIDGIRNNASNWQPFIDAPVKYCLSKPIENQLCRVNFNIPSAVSVIISNLVKMFVLGYIALCLAPDRLLVLGDTVQSFLSRPDPCSRQSCLASVQLLRNKRSRVTYWKGARVLLPTKKRWVTPVGKKRVRIGISLYVIAFFTVLFLFIWSIVALQIPANLRNIWSLGFGQPSEQTVISWAGSRGDYPSIPANVVLANMPHLIFSFIYFQWNAIFTSMLMGKEWNDFSTSRVALRVSDKPQQRQQSRHFLQLPFQFSVPLISASILLHWLISQSIFTVAIELLNDDNSISWGLITCGYSPIAILTNLFVSLVIPISVYAVGRRQLPGLMPAAGSCSLAIAAACHHPDGGEHPEAALGTLRWGVMRDWKRYQNQQEEQEYGEQESRGLLQTTSGYEHCGLSDMMVEDPQEGVIYS